MTDGDDTKLRDAIKTIGETILELRANVATDSRDAARYRWLRDRSIADRISAPFIVTHPMDLDAAIDEAMAKESKVKKTAAIETVS